MDADYIPALGVESVEMYGRLSVLLCPLTNVIPLVRRLVRSILQHMLT